MDDTKHPTSPQQTIVDSCAKAQRLIDDLYRRDPTNDTFSQVGLLDGSPTVEGYVQRGELGLALEHLLYMIHESDIRYDADTVKSLHALAAHFKLKNHYTAANLERLGVTCVYNVPGQ